MKQVLSSLLLLAFLAGCKKNDTEAAGSGLPDTSSSGKNFIACKVNGQLRIYSGKPTLGRPNGVGYAHFVDYIGVTGSSSKYNDDVRVRLSTRDTINAEVTYTLGGEAEHSGLFIDNSPPDDPQYETAFGSGWVRFSRLDKDIAAGTFAFTAYLDGQPGADSVVITDGRFDIAR